MLARTVFSGFISQESGVQSRVCGKICVCSKENALAAKHAGWSFSMFLLADSCNRAPAYRTKLMNFSPQLQARRPDPDKAVKPK